MIVSFHSPRTVDFLLAALPPPTPATRGATSAPTRIFKKAVSYPPPPPDPPVFAATSTPPSLPTLARATASPPNTAVSRHSRAFSASSLVFFLQSRSFSLPIPSCILHPSAEARLPSKSLRTLSLSLSLHLFSLCSLFLFDSHFPIFFLLFSRKWFTPPFIHLSSPLADCVVSCFSYSSLDGYTFRVCTYCGE